MAQQAPLTVDEIVARKQDIINKIPSTLPPNEKETMRKHIEEGLQALQKNDHGGIQNGIQGVLEVAKRNPHAGDAPGQASTGGGPHNMMSQAWMSCGDSCYHHLSDGNAAAYGVCYWGCVIFS